MTNLDSKSRSSNELTRASARSRPAHDARTDVALLEATLQGDAGAFGEFYVRWAARLFSYFRPRCTNAQDAYDLVSETFAQAYQSLRDFDPERGEPGGWLFGIAKNKYRRYARRGAVEHRGRQRLELNHAPLSPDDLDRLEHELDMAAVHDRIRPAIRDLPPTLGDAVRLRCIEGYEYDDIASHLGVRPATARKRVSRGLRHLADVLGDENPFRADG